jgi:hypothetical protein
MTLAAATAAMAVGGNTSDSDDVMMWAQLVVLNLERSHHGHVPHVLQVCCSVLIVKRHTTAVQGL